MTVENLTEREMLADLAYVCTLTVGVFMSILAIYLMITNR